MLFRSIREKITSVELYDRLEKECVFTGDLDSIESYLHLKALSNPVYLAVEYQIALERSEILDAEVMRWKDPLRKSLAIARYTWLRSNYDEQYLKENIEISLVSRSIRISSTPLKYLFRHVRSLQLNC